MVDRASPCSAEKRRLRPASSERIHHAPRMNCMLTSTGQPHRSVSPSNRCSTAPTARTAVAVCNENAELRYVPWCWPSSLSVSAFPLSTANPSFGRGRGNLALPCRGIHPRFVVVPLTVVVARTPLPDPRGQPRLPLMFLPLSAAPVDIDAVALDVAAVTLSCVLGTRASVPAPSPPCFRQFGSFWWQQNTALPGSVCSLPPRSPSDARVAPSDGVTPAAKRVALPRRARRCRRGGRQLVPGLKRVLGLEGPRCGRERRKRLHLF